MDPYLEELKKLHEFHKTNRFSKIGIAIALGVNRRTVRRWLHGENPPTEKHQKSIKNLIEELKKSYLPKES